MDDTQTKGRAPSEGTALSTSSSSDYSRPVAIVQSNMAPVTATHRVTIDIAIGLTQTHQSHLTHHIWEVAHG